MKGVITAYCGIFFVKLGVAEWGLYEIMDKGCAGILKQGESRDDNWMHIIHPLNFINFMLRLKKWTEMSARTIFSLLNTDAIKKSLEDCPR